MKMMKRGVLESLLEKHRVASADLAFAAVARSVAKEGGEKRQARRRFWAKAQRVSQIEKVILDRVCGREAP